MIIKKIQSQSLIIKFQKMIHKKAIAKMIQATKNNKEQIPVDLKILH